LDGVLATMHNRDIEQVMKVNVIAPIVVTKYASRSMMLSKSGRRVHAVPRAGTRRPRHHRQRCGTRFYANSNDKNTARRQTCIYPAP
jgi:NAD(P)-dependent dehydrogenase (short-subunit alcohol dehydrogenase family)